MSNKIFLIRNGEDATGCEPRWKKIYTAFKTRGLGEEGRTVTVRPEVVAFAAYKAWVPFVFAACLMYPIAKEK